MSNAAVPKLFHVADEQEIFCGTALVDWTNFTEQFCRRCNLHWPEANQQLALNLGLRYEALTVEDLASINETLKENPNLIEKDLLITAGIPYDDTYLIGFQHIYDPQSASA